MKDVYRKSLEKTARQIILIGRTDTLIKLILRTVVRNLKVKHAGIFLYDREKDEYVLKVSRGGREFKIPSGFVKIQRQNPVIRYFLDRKLSGGQDFLLAGKKAGLSRLKTNQKEKKFFRDLKENLFLYQAKVCLPGFFRKDLIAVLFLGEKINKRNFVEEDLSFLSVLAANIVMAVKNTWLIEDINKQLEKNKRLFLQTVSALVSSIEAKDKYTVGHTERVMKHSLIIAQYLNGKIKNGGNWHKFIEDLRIAALLHDIGKIGISERLLNKKYPLTEKEKKVIERHPLTGVDILNHIEDFKDVLLGVKHHHERYDGTGYPCSLKGKRIPLIAAVISIADAFDAMTVGRPYRGSLSFSAAVKEIESNRGKQFYPQAVDAFLKAYKSEDGSKQ